MAVDDSNMTEGNVTYLVLMIFWLSCRTVTLQEIRVDGPLIRIFCGATVLQLLWTHMLLMRSPHLRTQDEALLFSQLNVNYMV